MAGYFDEDKPTDEQAVATASPPDNTSPEATDVTKVGEAAPQGAAQARIYQGGTEYDPNTGVPLGQRGGYQQPGEDSQQQRQLQQAFAQLPPEAQQRVWLNRIQLSQAEKFHAQQLQNGISAIDQAETAGTITKEVADAARVKVRTGLDVLHMRDMQAKQLQSELQNKEMQANVMRAQQLNAMTREADAKTFDKGVSVEPHPQPGQSYWYVNPHTGALQEVHSKAREHEEEVAARKAADEIKLKTHVDDLEQKAQQHDEKIFRELEGDATAAVEKKLLIGPGPGGIHGEYYDQTHGKGSALTDHIEAELKRRLGATSAQQYVENRKKERAAARGDKPAATITPPADKQPPPAETPAVVPEDKPFTRSDPKSMTASQKQSVDDLEALKPKIKEIFKGDGSMGMRSNAVDENIRLLEQHGSISLMPPKERMQFRYNMSLYMNAAQVQAAQKHGPKY